MPPRPGSRVRLALGASVGAAALSASFVRAAQGDDAVEFASVVFSTAGSHQTTIPEGADTVEITVLGGGGGGAGGTHPSMSFRTGLSSGGGGGAGGSVATCTLDVTPHKLQSRNLKVTVGAGGPGGRGTLNQTENGTTTQAAAAFGGETGSESSVQRSAGSHKVTVPHSWGGVGGEEDGKGGTGGQPGAAGECNGGTVESFAGSTDAAADTAAGTTGKTPFELLGEALDGLVAHGLLPEDRRPGAEFLAWSAVHGLAVLLIDGPLRGLRPTQAHDAGQHVIDMIERGI
ncbi:TetR-like C-terminal domain-containing protein [Streptomyces sp. NPDC090046]|uniref:TetR-like C-terminal domain-containing protein n=1 Tax=Streptomyces sp. NPDC090046 TaxID=3365928 RepID=UPI00383089D4